MNSIKLTIGGKNRSFRLGLGMLGDVMDHLDVGADKMDRMISQNPFKAIPVMMYFAHVHECKKAGEAIDFTIEDFKEWLDEEGWSQGKSMTAFMRAYLESVSKYAPQVDAEEVKSEKVSKAKKK